MNIVFQLEKEVTSWVNVFERYQKSEQQSKHKFQTHLEHVTVYKIFFENNFAENHFR